MVQPRDPLESIFTFISFSLVFPKCLFQLRPFTNSDLTGGIGKPIEKPEIVDHSVVPCNGYVNPGFVELSTIRFSFVAKNVALRHLDQGRRQAFQLFNLSVSNLPSEVKAELSSTTLNFPVRSSVKHYNFI